MNYVLFADDVTWIRPKGDPPSKTVKFYKLSLIMCIAAVYFKQHSRLSDRFQCRTGPIGPLLYTLKRFLKVDVGGLWPIFKC